MHLPDKDDYEVECFHEEMKDILEQSKSMLQL